MGIIELTLYVKTLGGKINKIYVNVSKIVDFADYAGDGTITINFENDYYYRVNESPSQILELIKSLK